jgi:hypothetical protein
MLTSIVKKTHDIDKDKQSFTYTKNDKPVVVNKMTTPYLNWIAYVKNIKDKKFFNHQKSNFSLFFYKVRNQPAIYEFTIKVFKVIGNNNDEKKKELERLKTVLYERRKNSGSRYRYIMSSDMESNLNTSKYKLLDTQSFNVIKNSNVLEKTQHFLNKIF